MGTTIDVEELWEQVEMWQGHLENVQSSYWDSRFLAEALASVRERVAEVLAETLVVIHTLSRHFEN